MQEITVTEALARVAAGSRLIDVREQDEWDGGHAPQASFLPMSAIQERWSEVDADDTDPAIIVCHSGHRSGIVADALERQGVPAVSLQGGMVAWQAAGGAVVTGSDTAADTDTAASTDDAVSTDTAVSTDHSASTDDAASEPRPE